MPGKVALASADFAGAMAREDLIRSGTVSNYEMVCLYIPPEQWLVRYVADFTAFPAGLEPNVRMPTKVRCKPFVLSFRSDPTKHFTAYIYGRFEYGKPRYLWISIPIPRYLQCMFQGWATRTRVGT